MRTARERAFRVSICREDTNPCKSIAVLISQAKTRSCPEIQLANRTRHKVTSHTYPLHAHLTSAPFSPETDSGALTEWPSFPCILRNSPMALDCNVIRIRIEWACGRSPSLPIVAHYCTRRHVALPHAKIWFRRRHVKHGRDGNHGCWGAPRNTVFPADHSLSSSNSLMIAETHQTSRPGDSGAPPQCSPSPTGDMTLGVSSCHQRRIFKPKKRSQLRRIP